MTEALPNRRRSAAAILIYTDGAARAPRPGGWGAWLRTGEPEKEMFGGEA